jgi:hypothetical protein
METDNTEIAKTLASAHLESIYDKYLVIGFNSETGGDFFSNCDQEQLGLLLMLFQERILAMQNEPKPSTTSLN